MSDIGHSVRFYTHYVRFLREISQKHCTYPQLSLPLNLKIKGK